MIKDLQCDNKLTMLLLEKQIDVLLITGILKIGDTNSKGSYMESYPSQYVETDSNCETHYLLVSVV